VGKAIDCHQQGCIQGRKAATPASTALDQGRGGLDNLDSGQAWVLVGRYFGLERLAASSL
jgi:hypothetical protein